MNITILTDNPDSWIIPYLDKLSYDFKHIFSHEYISDGDIMFILSCEKIVPEEYLRFHKYNIVIHPSKLPHGKGWSPLAWQVLENKDKIPVTLFEASEKVDSGDVYLVDYIYLDGTELNDEIKDKQGKLTIKMMLTFIDNYPMKGVAQSGKESFYKKRTTKDSELNINKTIKDQFNLLRVVDNDKYPAFFYHNGQKYIVKVYKG